MLRCNWDPREQAFCLRFALLSSHISPHVLTGFSNIRIDFLVHANKVSSSEKISRKELLIVEKSGSRFRKKLD